MAETENTPQKASVRIDYIKSGLFRVIHADGVYGGLTPRGLIHLDFFSERPTIPQQCHYPADQVTDRAIFGIDFANEIVEKRVARDSVAVREVEVGVTLDVALAKSVVAWLQEKIEAAEQVSPSSDSKES
jgi:hypothetical protein